MLEESVDVLAEDAFRVAIGEITMAEVYGWTYDGEQNQVGKSIRISDALKRDVAFFGRVNPELIAVDFDHEDGAEKAYELAGLWRQECVILSSGGKEGRAHLWVRSPNEQRRQKMIAQAKELGGDVRFDIRPPLAKHRTGTRSFLLNCTPAEALRRLSPRRKQLQDRRTDISAALVTGWVKGKRSTGLFWLACEHIRASIDEAEFIEGVLSYPHGAGEKVFECRNSHEGRVQYLSGVFQAAKKQTHASALKGLEWFEAIPVKGRLSDVAKAVAIVAGKANNTRVSISDRLIADMCGMSKATANKYKAKLVEAGYLKRIARYERKSGKASVYLLTFPKNFKISAQRLESTLLPPLREVTKKLEKKCEAFKGRRASLEILEELLATGSMTASELASARGKSVQSVYPHLVFLNEAGLITKTGKRWQVACEAEEIESRFVALAEARGTLGHVDKVRRRHEAERFQFRTVFADVETGEILDSIPDFNKKEVDIGQRTTTNGRESECPLYNSIPQNQISDASKCDRSGFWT